MRTIDVPVDEDCSCPGYEYHYLDDDDDPPVLVSQIPEGFVGPTSELDASRGCLGVARSDPRDRRVQAPRGAAAPLSSEEALACW